MFTPPSTSKSHAKKACILGHRVSGMGEKTLALKYQKALLSAGYESTPIFDIVETLGEEFESLAELNYALAEAEHGVMDDLKNHSLFAPADLFLILSWCFGLAAVFATGIHKTGFTAARLFVHHPDERIITKLYEPADLLITESLLANERALVYNIDPAKVLYLPNCYPAECDKIQHNRTYASQLALSQGKTLGRNTKIIGCVSRLEYGKNVEFAVEAVRRLALQKHDVVLLLKGDFPLVSPYPDYQKRLQNMLSCYQDEPWFVWDRTPTPFPQVMEHYASFDLLLHPSGAEGGGHVVVECLGLKKPVVLLDCSTHPYAFKDVATFVKTTGIVQHALLPFYIPDLDDLCKKLEKELLPPDPIKVEERFHERVLAQRISLLLEPDGSYIKKLYMQDRKLYGIV